MKFLVWPLASLLRLPGLTRLAMQLHLVPRCQRDVRASVAASHYFSWDDGSLRSHLGCNKAHHFDEKSGRYSCQAGVTR